MHLRARRGSVAALASLVLGVGLGGALTIPAEATPLVEQVGASNVVLYSFAGASTDIYETVTLGAGAGSSFNFVRFEHRPTGSTAATPWEPIAEVARGVGGMFTAEWSPADALEGTALDIRAVGIPATGPVVPSVAETGVRFHPLGTSYSSFDRTILEVGAEVGYFQAPYAAPHNGRYLAVTGDRHFSNTPAAANIGYLTGGGAVAGTAVEGPTVTGAGFYGALDISGYPLDTTAPVLDQIALYAEIQGPGGRFTPDVAAAELYRQTITQITAMPLQSSTTADTGTVIVAVTDQSGQPVVGAEVRSSQGDNQVEYTDARGRASFTQNSGTTIQYWANATSSGPYEAGAGDKQATATITKTQDTSDRLVGASNDGPAFDKDEYAAGDITVQLQTAAGAGKSALGRTLSYHWRITPFGTNGSIITPAPDGTVAGSISGRFTVPLPTGQPSGRYELFAALPAGGLLGGAAIPESVVLTVRAGEAALSWDGTAPHVATAGTTAQLTGRLRLEDGTALPGRTVDLSFVKGAPVAGGDPTPDAAAVSATATTNATGQFTAQVIDPNEGVLRHESGGKLTAKGGTTPDIGPNTDATATLGVDFKAPTTVPAGSTVEIAAVPLPANQEANNELGSTPGQLQNGTLTVKGPDGLPLAGRAVTLTADHGFFLPPGATGNGRFDPAPVSGADYGKWRGVATIAVTTDDQGKASFTTSTGREVGFDDDGMLTATVSATAGAATDSQTFDWNTVNEATGGESALQIGSVELVRSTGSPATAEAGDAVDYDVVAKDGFGNKVGGVDAAVTCTDGTPADPCPTITGAGVSDFDNAGDVTFESPDGGTWTFRAAVDYPNTVWNAGATSPVKTNRTVSDTADQTWAPIDWAAASYTIAQTPNKKAVDVGTTVTETVTVIDEHGEPIVGAVVEFTRGATAPVPMTTDASGAAAYSFTATEAGTETVTATVRDGATAVKTLSDAVTFKVRPTVRVRATSPTGNRDRVTAVSSDPAETADAVARLFRRVGGEWVPGRALELGSDGRVTFEPMDRNGNGLTAYQVVLSATDTSFRAASEPRAAR